MQEDVSSDNLEECERTEAKKRSEESMNFMYWLQQQGTNCDFVIHTEDGGEFPIHSAIICRCSPYFQALFSYSFHGNHNKDVTLPGIDSDMMRLIVQYAYTRKVVITLQNASDLMVDADQFAITTLVEQCGRFMSRHLDATNCVEVYRFARDYFFQKLANHAYCYIMKKFRSVCSQSIELLQLGLDDFINLINRDELNVDNEAVVWETVVTWIEFDFEPRVDHIPTLMRSVRLGLMDPVYFREKVKNHPYVKQQEDRCREIIIEALIHLEDLEQENINSSIIPSMCRPRLPHELIFALGGWSGGNPTSIIETYDIRSDRWTDVYVADSPGPRAYHGCVIIGDEVYMIGGFDGMEYFNGCWCLNVGGLCWREISPMHCQRCYVSVAEVDGLLYAMGGYNGHQRQNTAEVYIPANNQWKFIAPMHMQRSDADATSFKGKVYIVGGFNGQTCMNSMECYDPVANQWTLLASMRTLRSGVSCAAYHGCIYAVGGFNGDMRLRSVEKYDVSTGTWTQVEDMRQVRSNFGIEVLEDRLFVIGGFNGLTTVNDVECYDAGTGSWTECGQMNIVRSALSTCRVSGMDNIYAYVDWDARDTMVSRGHRHSSNGFSGCLDRSVSN